MPAYGPLRSKVASGKGPVSATWLAFIGHRNSWRYVAAATRKRVRTLYLPPQLLFSVSLPKMAKTCHCRLWAMSTVIYTKFQAIFGKSKPESKSQTMNVRANGCTKITIRNKMSTEFSFQSKRKLEVGLNS